MKKNYFMAVFTAFALLLLASPPVAAARAVQTDHPLISSYTGSKLYKKDVKQYDEYTVFKGWDKQKKDYVTQQLTGKVTRIIYKNPKQRSLLEIYSNYKSALEQDGITVLYECNQANMECVDGRVGTGLRRRFGITAIGNKAGRYMFARLDQENQTAYIVLAVNDMYTDIHVVEVKNMETGKVNVTLAALTDGIDKDGFVVVDGIYFDTDKTTLKQSSKPAMEQVAALLKARPELELYVVGHTDMQGSLSHNMTLSEGRSRAVVNALVSEYGIAASRLQGHGVGPLAPVASNAQEAGRAQNRRVVLVQRN